MFQATEPEETWEQTKADSAVLSAGLWTGATSWTLETRQCNKGKWGARGRGAPSPPEPVSAFWEEATEEGPLAPDPRLRLSLAAWGTLQEAGLCSWLPWGTLQEPRAWAPCSPLLPHPPVQTVLSCTETPQAQWPYMVTEAKAWELEGTLEVHLAQQPFS